MMRKIKESCFVEGILSIQRGNYREALYQMSSMLDHNHIKEQNEMLMLLCGICCYYLGKEENNKYEIAIRYFSEIIDSADQQSTSLEKKVQGLVARYYRASSYIDSSQDYPDAIADFEIFCQDEFLEEVQKSELFDRQTQQQLVALWYQAWNDLGTCYRKQKEFAKAIQCFQKALAGNNEEGTKINLGIVKRKSGDLKGAITIFQEVLEYDPRNVDSYNNLGVCYMEMAWFEKARENFQKSLEIEPTNAYALFHLGLYYQRLKDYDQAIVQYDKVQEWYPNYYKAIYCQADCYNHQRNFTQALKGMKQVLRLRPHDAKALANIGWCYENLGQYEEAIQYYEKALQAIAHEEKKEESLRYISTLNNLGSCHYKCGWYEEAIDYFKEALNYNAEDGYSFYNIGNCYHLLGNYGEARSYFEKALSVSPVDSVARNNFLHARSHYICVLLEQFRQQSDEVSLIEEANYLTKETDKREQLAEQIKTIWNRGVWQGFTEYSQDALVAMAKFLMGLLADKQMKSWKLLEDAHLLKSEEGYHFFESILRHESIKTLAEEKRGHLMALFLLIYADVAQMKKLYSISDSQIEAAHYTKTEYIQSILEGKLRLANAAYMNDPSEGEAFLTLLMKGQGAAASDLIGQYYPNFNLSDERNSGRKVIKQSNIYLLSLTKSVDTIPMWVTYGDDGKGCCFVFEEDFFDTREEPVPGADGTEVSLNGANAEKYVLYEVQYIKKDQEGHVGTKLQKARELTAEIYRNMERLERYFNDSKEMISNECRNTCRSFVVNMLDQVRFLFKTDEYEHEKEVRLIKFSDRPFRQQNGIGSGAHDNMEKENSSHSGQMNFPKLYIEMNLPLNFKEAILGPKITTSAQLVQYLYDTKKVKKVTKSSIHYR